MECKACGYKHGYMWVKDEWTNVSGEHGDFFKFNGNFTVNNTSGYYERVDEVKLNACPAYGIVRMERF